MKLNQDEVSFFKRTDDDWCGSFQLSSGEKLVCISFFSDYDFDHLPYDIYESAYDEFKAAYGNEVTNQMNKTFGIKHWYIAASGDDDLVIKVKYKDRDVAMSDLSALLNKELVNLGDMSNLIGERV
ncbi:hypothetical protein [Vibrio sp. D431a]|uniref:hypothetical protein n=1 Tax=Vibrio sp. D431a TaxID=2837388 RepID=UPI0025566A85|nr:hypothetical protein [Vibrio sp. D431a]MDK9790039.1 hypothetical protein [Vibrio sp. D431a]